MLRSLKGAALVTAAVAAFSMSARADTIYSNIPSTLDANYSSLGYEATSTSEFGDRVTFAGVARHLDSATFTLSSWARSEDFGGATSYQDALTLNLYAAGTGSTPGALLGSVTQTFDILYRPTGYSANGIAFNVTFDLSSLDLNAPDSIVYGLAFNTQNYGANPTGTDGPYDSLNFALNEAAGGGVTVGTNNNLDDTFWNTSYAGFYTDGGASGVGTFREDTGWTGYTPMAQFDASVAVPLPTAASMSGALVMGTLLRRRR